MPRHNGIKRRGLEARTEAINIKFEIRKMKALKSKVINPIVACNQLTHDVLQGET